MWIKVTRRARFVVHYQDPDTLAHVLASPWSMPENVLQVELPCELHLGPKLVNRLCSFMPSALAPICKAIYVVHHTARASTSGRPSFWASMICHGPKPTQE
jgi:hypothetical protein